MDYRNEWLYGCFGSSNAEKIQATFRNGEKVNYTSATMELLKTDKTVVEIVSLDTGEIYFERDLDGTITINC